MGSAGLRNSSANLSGVWARDRYSAQAHSAVESGRSVQGRYSVTGSDDHRAPSLDAADAARADVHVQSDRVAALGAQRAQATAAEAWHGHVARTESARRAAAFDGGRTRRRRGRLF